MKLNVKNGSKGSSGFTKLEKDDLKYLQGWEN